MARAAARRRDPEDRRCYPASERRRRPLLIPSRDRDDARQHSEWNLQSCGAVRFLAAALSICQRVVERGFWEPVVRGEVGFGGVRGCGLCIRVCDNQGTDFTDETLVGDVCSDCLQSNPHNVFGVFDVGYSPRIAAGCQLVFCIAKKMDHCSDVDRNWRAGAARVVDFYRIVACSSNDHRAKVFDFPISHRSVGADYLGLHFVGGNRESARVFQGPE